MKTCIDVIDIQGSTCVSKAMMIQNAKHPLFLLQSFLHSLYFWFHKEDLTFGLLQYSVKTSFSNME